MKNKGYNYVTYNILGYFMYVVNVSYSRKFRPSRSERGGRNRKHSNHRLPGGQGCRRISSRPTDDLYEVLSDFLQLYPLLLNVATGRYGGQQAGRSQVQSNVRQ